VVQPHRYSRLAQLRDQFATCFSDADVVIVADVYPAGETPIEGVNRDMLVRALRAAGQREVIALEQPSELAEMVWQVARPGDLVVCLGAGSITNWAYALPGALQAIAAERGGLRSVANTNANTGHAG
jgi:UDP-N-acetylmuramate--alanine ligase